MNFVWMQTIGNFSFRGKLGASVFNRQTVNHFQNHSEISNKVSLFNNLRRICTSNNLNLFNFVPLTFTFSLNNKNFEQEIDHFFRYFKALKMFNLFQTNQILWKKVNEKVFSSVKRVQQKPPLTQNLQPSPFLKAFSGSGNKANSFSLDLRSSGNRNFNSFAQKVGEG